LPHLTNKAGFEIVCNKAELQRLLLQHQRVNRSFALVNPRKVASRLVHGEGENTPKYDSSISLVPKLPREEDEKGDKHFPLVALKVNT
jgi:hypothetical protein